MREAKLIYIYQRFAPSFALRGWTLAISRLLSDAALVVMRAGLALLGACCAAALA
eukprot:COSAG06_NODE_59299_length_274_cov_1.188571_1_plen_54_part_01